MKPGIKSIWITSIFLILHSYFIAKAQSLSGTTWNINVSYVSTKPYNFIFGATGNTGSVLMPDNSVAKFTWSEDGKGNWTITLEHYNNGIKKIETFYGKIKGNVGSGYYSNTPDRRNLKPISMIKKQ